MSLSIHRTFPQGVPKAIGPYTPVTSTANLIFISGQLGINPQTNQIDCHDIEGQTHQVMKNLKNALQALGSNFSLVLKTTVLLSDIGNFGKVNQIYSSYFEKDQYPARTCYAVQALPKNGLVEIDAFAFKPLEHKNLEHKALQHKAIEHHHHKKEEPTHQPHPTHQTHQTHQPQPAHQTHQTQPAHS